MPRQNDNHVPRDGGRRRGGPRKRNPIQPASIHFIESLGRGSSSNGSGNQSVKKNEVETTFERWIFFGSNAVELVRNRVLSEVDLGIAHVAFTGARSQKPDKKIAYIGPRANVNPHGRVVLSGKVAAVDLDEIGHGRSRIRQAVVPTAHPDFDAPKWLNIDLGRRPEGFDVAAFSRALQLDGPLELSPVFVINGRISGLGDGYRRQEAWTNPPTSPR
jgi:hypothetical protein